MGNKSSVNSGHNAASQPSNQVHMTQAIRVAPTHSLRIRRKHQMNSLAAEAAVFVIMSGGMSVAWSLGVTTISNLKVSKHTQICWFIAAILGALVSGLIGDRIVRKHIFLLAAILVTIKGLLFISLPRTELAIVFGQYLDGFANGLVIVPSLVLVGEESTAEFRGTMAAAVDTLSFNIGLFIHIFLESIWMANANYTPFPLNCLSGALVLIYGIFGIATALFLCIESPYYYLLRNLEDLAIDSFRRLHPDIVIVDTNACLNEHKQFIQLNGTWSWQQSILKGLPSLLKLIIYRILASISMSTFVIAGFLLAVANTANGTMQSERTWLFFGFGGVRVLSAIVMGLSWLDSIGRKKLMLFNAVISGALCITIGGLLNVGHVQDIAVIILMIGFQLFGVGFTAPSSVYMSEAYPMAVKPLYIALTYGLEMLVQLSICTIPVSLHGVSAYFITLGTLHLGFSWIAYFVFPETKRLTLRQALERFLTLNFPCQNCGLGIA